MNIDTLFMFTEIVNNGSITKTADRLHLSQSALSQQIKSMEEMLDCQLLNRSNQGVTSTQAGEIVYQNAQEVLDVYRTMLKQLEALRKDNQPFHIASAEIIYTYELPCALFRIQKVFPNAQIETVSMTSMDVEAAIDAGQADVGLIVGPPDNRELYHRHIFCDEVHLVAASELKKEPSVSVEELIDMPLILMNKAHRTRQQLDRYFARLGIQPQTLHAAYEFGSVESIKQAVVNGLGAAFLPYSSIKKELYNKELKMIDIDRFSFSYDYYLLKNEKSKQQDEQTKKIVAYLEKTLESMIC